MTAQEERADVEVRMAAVMALREAADAWAQGGWSDNLPPRGYSRPQLIIHMVERAADYLHARADEIEAQP